jgi:hypothetical protein
LAEDIGVGRDPQPELLGTAWIIYLSASQDISHEPRLKTSLSTGAMKVRTLQQKNKKKLRTTIKIATTVVFNFSLR